MLSERLCTLRPAEVQAIPGTITNLTIPSRRHHTIAHAICALAPIAALAAALLAAAPASAAPSCARQVIEDWYDDGRVDRTYPLHCYDDAIESLPADVRDYSTAKEDIQRALQARMRNEPAPPAGKDPSPGGGTSTTPTKPPKNQTTTDVSEPKNENPPEASGQVDSDSASSVPIPLLVLAGLALLLIAGGSAGYFIRRYQGRNNPPPAV